MFEELFKRPHTIKRYRAAPLVEPRERYLRRLAEAGASRLALQLIAGDQVRLIQVLDLREGETVTMAQIEAVAPEWDGTRHHKLGRRPRTSPRSTKCALGRAARWLRFLGWLDEPEEDSHPCSAVLGAFEDWMRAERGLAEGTIGHNLRGAKEFLDRFAATGVKPLASVRLTDVDAHMEAKTAQGHYSRATVRGDAERLRAFFRFAEHRGWCTPGMAEGIVPSRHHRDQHVRSTLSREDVHRLPATTDGNRRADKRDRAILLLLIVCGLRAGEVRTLQLDDLDREGETLRVHRPKTGRTDLFPLSKAVGNAIIRYLVDVRPPRSERALFLTLAAPIRPLGRTAPGCMVRRRMDEAGIVAQRRGTHALRHTAARNLLDQGVSMKVIGDCLGHRNPRSTKAYARFDLNALREVADFDLEGLA